MKSILTRFVSDQSGAVAIEDGLTALLLTLGFMASVYSMNATIGGVYARIFSLLARCCSLSGVGGVSFY
jgi:Flp pilus assembly pilin Flp